MPAKIFGAGTVFDRLEKKKRTSSTKHDRQAEGHQQLVLGRALVEMAHDHPFHHDADDEQERAAGDHGHDVGAGVLVGDVARRSRRA